MLIVGKKEQEQGVVSRSKSIGAASRRERLALPVLLMSWLMSCTNKWQGALRLEPAQKKQQRDEFSSCC